MIRVAIAAFCAAVVAAGCGSSAQPSSKTVSTKNVADTAPAAPTAAATSAPAPARAARKKGTTVKVVNSRYGRVLADGRGEAFYLFARETSNESLCYGACAKNWPPVIAKGTPHAGPGGHGHLIGVTRRRDGKLQLTYAGHPLYYYVGDSPGRILCQAVNEFGGLWLVVRPNGKPVR